MAHGKMMDQWMMEETKEEEKNDVYRKDQCVDRSQKNRSHRHPKDPPRHPAGQKKKRVGGRIVLARKK
jgi:hypothetical protein